MLPVITTYSQPRSERGKSAPQKMDEFLKHDTALTFAAEAVMKNIIDLHKFDQSAKDLFDEWLEKGIVVTIDPDDPKAPFDAEDFARLIVLQITNDYSHPLFLEVTCTDTLNMPSGFSAPAREWTFFVKAPATYQGESAKGIVRRATDVLYDDMSHKAMIAEGSSYSLLAMSVREVTSEEAAKRMQQDRGATLFHVQNDGSLRTSPQAVPSR